MLLDHGDAANLLSSDVVTFGTMDGFEPTHPVQPRWPLHSLPSTWTIDTVFANFGEMVDRPPALEVQGVEI